MRQKIESAFQQTWETAEAIHKLLERVDLSKVREGEDIGRYATKNRISLPAILKGARITYHVPKGKPTQDSLQMVRYIKKRPRLAAQTRRACGCIGRWCVCISCEAAGPSGGWKCLVTIERRF